MIKVRSSEIALKMSFDDNSVCLKLFDRKFASCWSVPYSLSWEVISSGTFQLLEYHIQTKISSHPQIVQQILVEKIFPAVLSSTLLLYLG